MTTVGINHDNQKAAIGLGAVTQNDVVWKVLTIGNM